MRILLSIILIFFFSAFSFAQQVLTLDEAVNIALQRNTTLQKAENNLETYKASVKSSWGNLLPSLNASGRFGWSRSEDEGTTYNIGGVVITTPASITESRSYNASVSSSWTLFDGLSNFAQVSQSKSDYESAQLSLDRLKQDVVFETISRYYDVLNAKQLLKVKEDDVKWAQKNLETITERNKLGAVTLADVYAQQVRLGNAELEVIRAKNSLETSKSNLLYYLGLDVLEEYEFPSAFSTEEEEVLKTNLAQDYDNLSVLVEKALESRYDYHSAKLNLESANSGITIARSGHFPQLTGSLGFSSYANKFDKLFDNKTYDIGLSLSIPIFSGFSVAERVEVAQVLAKNREVEITELERQIQRNIQQTYLDLQAAKKALSVSEKNVTSAQENLKIEEEKYNLGSGRLLDVLVTNSEYTLALQNYINSQFAYIVLSEQLKYYLGVLDTENFE